jgi:hypothetical protein
VSTVLSFTVFRNSKSVKYVIICRCNTVILSPLRHNIKRTAVSVIDVIKVSLLLLTVVNPFVRDKFLRCVCLKTKQNNCCCQCYGNRGSTKFLSMCQFFKNIKRQENAVKYRTPNVLNSELYGTVGGSCDVQQKTGENLRLVWGIPKL